MVKLLADSYAKINLMESMKDAFSDLVKLGVDIILTRRIEYHADSTNLNVVYVLCCPDPIICVSDSDPIKCKDKFMKDYCRSSRTGPALSVVPSSK